MSSDDSVTARVRALIEEARTLAPHGGRAENSSHVAECVGWVTSALHAIELISPSQNNAYLREANRIASDEGIHGGRAPDRVRQLMAVLERLLIDVEGGLLTSIADQASGEAFDDFLDHADAYRKDGRKNEAGVIAGIVFEDTLRRVARKNGIEEGGEKLDNVITELANQEVITKIKAKRARSAAGLRTSAAHAQWNEFELDDVIPVIEFTREMISEHLDS